MEGFLQPLTKQKKIKRYQDICLLTDSCNTVLEGVIQQA
jgi:hypothetical protein